MKKLRKPLSLLLALLLLFGAFSAAPLSASAYEDQDEYDRGYNDGHQAGYDDYLSGGYTSPPSIEETSSDYLEGWNAGYPDGWSDAEAANPPEDEHTYEEGLADGRAAAELDYPANNYRGTGPEYGSDGDEYQTGFYDGYDERWDELVAADDNRETGYNDGVSAGQDDYNNNYKGFSTCPHSEADYPNYCEGWNEGYDDGWYGEYCTYDRGYQDGYDAAYGDFDSGYGENYTQPDEACQAYPDYMQGWSDGYSYRWGELNYYGDDENISFTTDEGSIFWINAAKRELTFVSGTFYGNFFAHEIKEKIGVSGSHFKFFTIRSVDPAEVPELSDQNLRPVRFEGDCSMMFSTEYTDDNCSLIDLRYVDTSDVTSFMGMFSRCSDLVHLDISSFDFDNAGDYGTYGMFAYTNALYCLTVASDFVVKDYMTLYNPSKNGLTGWVNCRGDGTVVSTPASVTLPIEGNPIEFDNIVTIDAADSYSKEPVMYVKKSVENEWDWFAGHSLTLNGDIGVNFFVELPVSTSTIYNDYLKMFKVEFEWKDNCVSVPLSNDMVVTVNGTKYYKVSCNVPAAEMAYNIHASIVYDGFKTAEWVYDDYSVREYGEYIINAPAGTFEKQDALVELAKQMLNYGAKAQQVFNVMTDDLANKNVAGYEMGNVTPEMIEAAITAANPGMTKSDMTQGTEGFGLKYYGTTVVFLTETSMRHYYTIANQSAYDSAKAGASFAVDERKLPYVFFEMKNIPAERLDSFYEFSIGGQTYNYSVLDYSLGILNSTKADANNKNLAMATYWYNRAANNYFV